MRASPWRSTSRASRGTSTDAVPSVIYTAPEFASVGKTQEQLEAEGIPFVSGQFPFLANGRAKAMEQKEGFVKVLAHAETDRVLGVHMMGPIVGEMIAEMVLAMEFGATAEDIARTCHPHPTLTEVVREAALDARGRVIHFEGHPPLGLRGALAERQQG